MKTFISLLFVCVISISCSITKINSEYFKYSDNVEMKVIMIKSTKTSDGSTSENVTYVGTGGRFKHVAFEFKNDSKQDEIIDFEDILLLDDKDNTYNVYSVAQNGTLMTTNQKFKLKLKAGKTRSYIVEYRPLFPKGQEVARIIIKGKEVKL